MDLDAKLPPLRPIDVVPAHGPDGDPVFVLHDMQQIAPRSVALSAAGYFALMHLDGSHSCNEIRDEYLRRFRVLVPVERIAELVCSLDEALLLQNERFEAVYAARRDAYAAAESRDSRQASPDAEALRAEIQAILAAASPLDQPRPVRGLIAPHLDYARGAPCYGPAYRLLAGPLPAERFVILGTNHGGRAQAVVTTRKSFLTPLGCVATDRVFLDRLDERVGYRLDADEYDHAHEHSVELQVHMLQVVRDGRPFEIVPVLCPSPCGPTGTAPADGRGPDLVDFADALGALLAEDPRPTVVIAGADLSHVGQRFGDPEPTTPEFLRSVELGDRALLSLLEQRREDELIECLREQDNPTRICSAGCIYALLRALPGRPCRLLHYHQAVNSPAETHVTCCAAVVE